MRNIRYNNDAVAVISRFLAIGIPMIILVIIHASNALGCEMWEPLLSICFAFALLVSGVIILVLGLKVGFYYPAIIIFMIWIVAVYVYIQFEGNII